MSTALNIKGTYQQHASIQTEQEVAPGLNRLFKIEPAATNSIQNTPCEQMQLMPATPRSQHLARLGEAALTPDQKILNDAGYQRVTIGGNDNRCWVRAPWFAIFNQHHKSGTMGNLQTTLRQTLEASKNPSVQKWLTSNRATLEQAFHELNSAEHSSNFTLNKQGYFSPAVESLILKVSEAVFSENPHSFVKLKSGKIVSALTQLQQGQAGYGSFSSLLLGAFDANAPLHSDQSVYNRHSLHVEWLGSDTLLDKQSECMLFHRSTTTGHFEVMLKNDDFRPAIQTSKAHPTAVARISHGMAQTKSDLTRMISMALLQLLPNVQKKEKPGQSYSLFSQFVAIKTLMDKLIEMMVKELQKHSIKPQMMLQPQLVRA